MSLIAYMEVFMKVINGLVMTLGEDKKCLCVWLLYIYYVSNFCRFANEDAKMSIRVLLHEIIFFSLSVFSSSEV